jgi:Mn2+/Fe2+ NRAMP family transporter
MLLARGEAQQTLDMHPLQGMNCSPRNFFARQQSGHPYAPYTVTRVRLCAIDDAASALEPFAGSAAKILFAVVLMGASLLAGAVLPLATSYAVSEVFGTPEGVNLDFRRAPIFFGLFTGMILFGAGLSLVPDLPVIQGLVAVSVLNGVLVPIMLVFILRLINDQRLMGALKNTRVYNIVGWGTFILITTAWSLCLAARS